MIIEIKNRFSGSTIFSGDYADIKAAVAAAKALNADLRGAKLYGADLSYVDLRGAKLYGADLSYVDLRGAKLYGAALHDADLSYADLSYADLSYANLRGANLPYADLSYANLRGANLYGANLPVGFIDSVEFQRTRILPAEGAVVGWKKCRNGVLVKVRVPEAAKRSHAFGRKCRAEYVEVLDVIGAVEGHSYYDDGRTIYRVGEIVRPDDFEDDWRAECAPGIHFFTTRAEAEAY